MRTRFRVAAALALFAGAVAFFGGPSIDVVNADDKKDEPRRVLEAIVGILRATVETKPDAVSAAKALRDDHWAVRHIASIRLGALGLDDAVVRALKDASHPGVAVPGADNPAVKAAQDFAPTVKPLEGVDAPPEPTVADEGIRTYVSLVLNELMIRKAKPAELVKLIVELPAYAEAANDPRARDFVAKSLVGVCDNEQLWKELGVKDTNAAVEGQGKKVFEWFAQNAPYFFFHPADHGVRVDAAARSAGEPSEKFREKNAWKADEGPNAPPVKDKKPRTIR